MKIKTTITLEIESYIEGDDVGELTLKAAFMEDLSMSVVMTRPFNGVYLDDMYTIKEVDDE